LFERQQDSPFQLVVRVQHIAGIRIRCCSARSGESSQVFHGPRRNAFAQPRLDRDEIAGIERLLLSQYFRLKTAKAWFDFPRIFVTIPVLLLLQWIFYKRKLVTGTFTIAKYLGMATLAAFTTMSFTYFSDVATSDIVEKEYAIRQARIVSADNKVREMVQEALAGRALAGGFRELTPEEQNTSPMSHKRRVRESCVTKDMTTSFEDTIRRSKSKPKRSRTPSETASPPGVSPEEPGPPKSAQDRANHIAAERTAKANVTRAERMLRESRVAAREALSRTVGEAFKKAFPATEFENQVAQKYVQKAITKFSNDYLKVQLGNVKPNDLFRAANAASNNPSQYVLKASIPSIPDGDFSREARQVVHEAAAKSAPKVDPGPGTEVNKRLPQPCCELCTQTTRNGIPVGTPVCRPHCGPECSNPLLQRGGPL
jgi:hypothetical protein